VLRSLVEDGTMVRRSGVALALRLIGATEILKVEHAHTVGIRVTRFTSTAALWEFLPQEGIRLSNAGASSQGTTP